MAISNDDLLKLVEILPEEAKQSAYDFLKFLTIGHKRPDWDEIDLLEPDDIPLSEEKERQMTKVKIASGEQPVFDNIDALFAKLDGN
ncbi:MAG: hypothetical protein WA125_08155 [Desulfosporosinus sp.]